MKNIISAIAILFLIASCSDDKKTVVNEEKEKFVSFISAYTSGIISAKSKIRIKLAEAQDKVEIGQKVEMNLFNFTPEISGKSYWEDEQTVVFEPAGNMISGQNYAATFLLPQLISEAKDKGNFSFDFKVIPQNYEVTIAGLIVPKNTQSKKVSLNGFVETADFADNTVTESMLRASQKSTVLTITWKHSQNNKRHDFTIENIDRKDEEASVNISWDGASLGVDKKGEKEYVVPGLNQYTIVSSRVIIGQSNYISVMFSNPLKEKQDLSGFITLADDQPRYLINGNELKLYPQSPIYGEVALKIFKKVKSSDGKYLKVDYTAKLQMPQSKPLVKMLANKGTILPNSQGLIMPFEAIGLKAVDVKVIEIFENNVIQYLQVNNLGWDYQLNRVGKPIMRKTINLLDADVTNLNKWNRFTLNLEDFIKVKSGAIYQIDISFRKHQALFFCGGEDEEADITDLNDADWDSESESSNWDNYENNNYENYDWNERDNPCHDTYYSRNKNVKKIILASDIGIVAKRADHGAVHVFVSNLLNAQPMTGIELIAYNFQQQVIGTATSNNEGMAKIETKGRPFLIVAKYEDQFGYLKVDDGSSLSLSNFNVVGKKIQKGIKGFIYGERGVWRPGDDIFLSFILEDKEHKLPENYPVILEFKNPQGQLEKKLVKTQSTAGIFTFKLKTQSDAPTGAWSVVVKAGGASFHKTLKIESIKPNRLKIDLDFKKERLTALEGTIKGDLNVKWLHGAIAKGLKAEYELLLAPTKTSFENYPNFSFDDDSKKFYADRQEVYSGKLDQNGYAKISVDMYVEDNPPGALTAIFTGKVYEEGGNFSIDKFTIPYYPYTSFVGVKSPEGDKRGMLLTDKDHNIRIATVDADGKPVSRNNMEVELYKLNWRWWWDNSSSDISNYVGRSYNTPIQQGKVATNNGEGTWKLNIKYPDWGRYYIKVTDPVSGHSAGKVVFVDWPGWAGKGKNGDGGGISMLNFEIEKESYNVGDEVRLTLPSSLGARVLVSLETGRKVVKTFTVETTDKTTEISFEVTKDMSPNVYASIMLIQPHSQTANDLPIRMYGIQSIKVTDPNTILQPKITMPSQLNPEQKFTVTVSEEQSRSMAYTIAMVDDGLLDLTRFKTPDPYQNFYAKEALGIKTWDVFDDVIGAYGGKIERLLAIGGDGELDQPKGQKANRFKPVVKYLGPFQLEAGNTNTHEIVMPQYVGSVRMMVVAAQDGAYGTTGVTTPVKQSVMTLATLPRVAGPAEEMDLPVTVFVSDDNIKNVKVTVETTGKLKLLSSNTQSLTFDRAGEQVIYFKVKAADALGIGKVNITATGGTTSAKYEIELDVRASNPEIVDVQGKVLSSNEKWTLNYEPFGMLGTNSAIIEISSLPPLNLEQRLRYLIQYPHGCIEQTTSSVFAQLYLEELTKINSETKSRISTNIDKAIIRLRKFQTSNGGFSYWPGQLEESDWGTNYAGHFLLEAKKKGYAVPDGMLNDWIKYQKSQANKWSRGRRNNDLVQAYRLYTLVLAGEKKMSAMNRMKAMDDLSQTAQWRLALAYAMAGFESPAEEMIASLSADVKESDDTRFTYGSRTRDRAMILETLSYLGRREEAYPIIEEIAEIMGDQRKWMSTQTTAYSLIGIVAYSKGQSLNTALDFEVNVGSTVMDYEVGGYVTQLKIKDEKNTTIKITNKSEAILHARLVRTGIPLVGEEKAGADNISMTVKYVNNKGNTINVNKLSQGTDFKAVITVKHPGVRTGYEELALTQIFPSGWEIINTRLDGTDQYDKGDKPKYMDQRDDRVMMYFDLNSSNSKTFEVRLNATYKGKYYLPAVSVEAMYDDTIYANNVGKWVSVVE